VTRTSSPSFPILLENIFSRSVQTCSSPASQEFRDISHDAVDDFSAFSELFAVPSETVPASFPQPAATALASDLRQYMPKQDAKQKGILQCLQCDKSFQKRGELKYALIYTFQKPMLILEAATQESTFARRNVIAAREVSLMEGISDVIRRQLNMAAKAYGISVPLRDVNMPVMALSDRIILNGIFSDYTVARHHKYCKCCMLTT